MLGGYLGNAVTSFSKVRRRDRGEAARSSPFIERRFSKGVSPMSDCTKPFAQRLRQEKRLSSDIASQDFNADKIKVNIGGNKSIPATSTATKAEISTAPAAQSLAIFAKS